MLQDVSNFSENQKVTLRTDKHQTAGQTSVVTVQSRWQLATLKTVTRELHAPQTRGKPSQKCNGLCCVMVGMRKTISANWLERLGHTRGKPPWQLPASHTHTHTGQTAVSFNGFDAWAHQTRRAAGRLRIARRLTAGSKVCQPEAGRLRMVCEPAGKASISTSGF